MKTLKFNFLSLLFLGLSLPLFATQTTSKEIHKEIEVRPDALIEISNQFGNLNISSWDENKVVIDVTITVKGSNPNRVQEKLDEINVDFSLSPEHVIARTIIDNGWGFKWFNSSRIKYQIDYDVKLPLSSSVDLSNDYGTLQLNALEGSAKISCDYGKLVIGELLNENNILSFDYTSNSTIDFMRGGQINADYSGFELLEASTISLNADYTNSKFNTLEKLEFKNDYGKLAINQINQLQGKGDFLTLRLGTLFKKLNLDLEFGSIRIDQINPSVESILIDSEYTGINLGIDPDWEFKYEIDLEFASLKNSLPIQHMIQQENSNKKTYKGFLKNENTTHNLRIDSEFGIVKLQPAKSLTQP